jgi:plasmid stabilization system protein ParE
MPEGRPYEVAWLPRALAALEEIRRKLREPAGKRELAEILRSLQERLRHEPLSLGEIYRSRGSVVEHLAVLSIVAIDFAVDTQRRFVLVRKCKEATRRGN